MSEACCCFGHRECYLNIEKELVDKITFLIEENGVDTFYTGGMGETDMLFSSVVRRVKQTHNEIKLILVKPYFSNDLNTNKEYYESAYDDIIIPDEIAEIHYKAAIEKRNRWMIDNSEYILACIYRDFGGAFKAVKYAEKKEKTVYNLCVIKK